MVQFRFKLAVVLLLWKNNIADLLSMCRKTVTMAVMYYLSRNGHLEHPHFMEVELCSPASPYLHRIYMLRR
jgi:hypothetical protein